MKTTEEVHENEWKKSKKQSLHTNVNENATGNYSASAEFTGKDMLPLITVTKALEARVSTYFSQTAKQELYIL